MTQTKYIYNFYKVERKISIVAKATWIIELKQTKIVEVYAKTA